MQFLHFLPYPKLFEILRSASILLTQLYYVTSLPNCCLFNLPNLQLVAKILLLQFLDNLLKVLSLILHLLYPNLQVLNRHLQLPLFLPILGQLSGELLDSRLFSLDY